MNSAGQSKKARIEVATEYSGCDADDGLFVGPA